MKRCEVCGFYLRTHISEVVVDIQDLCSDSLCESITKLSPSLANEVYLLLSRAGFTLTPLREHRKDNLPCQSEHYEIHVLF